MLITVEGIEGVGKTTNVDFIARWLQARAKKYIRTREPGGTPLAENIRNCLLDKTPEPITPMAELLLVFAARAQHYSQLIAPALQAGQVVLCDRFIDASYAYQGGGRGIDEQIIAQLEQWIIGTRRPDLTFLLDLPVAWSLQRSKTRKGDTDRIESEDHRFFEAVRKAYLHQCLRRPQQYVLIDASQPLETVQSIIANTLDRLIDE